MNKWIKKIGIFLLVFASCASLLIGFVFIYTKINLDYSTDELLFSLSKTSSITELYVDGSENHASSIQTYDPVLSERICLSDTRSKWCSIDEMPVLLSDAFISVEDQQFYSHHGVNFVRTGKALCNTVLKKQPTFGASTITQQVIKNISGDNEITLKRKFSEILRAMHLESLHSKKEILEMYFNIIPLGEQTIGIASASEVYFDKKPNELTPAEIALLIGITNAPTRYNPYDHAARAIEKRDQILSVMYQNGVIDQQTYRSALDEPLTLAPRRLHETEVISWFGETVLKDVRRDLIEQKGFSEEAASMIMERGGLKIYTTEEKDATTVLNHVFLDSGFTKGNDLSYAMVIINNDTGNLAAVLGSAEEKRANRLLNLATDAYLTPGSSLKPIALYAPLIEKKKIHEATVFDDVPLTFVNEGGKQYLYPQNYPRRYDGLTTVTNALKYSKNTVAIRLYQLLGEENIYHHLVYHHNLDSIVRTAYKEDGTRLTDLAPSPLALGQLTYGVTLRALTTAYASFPRDGIASAAQSYLAVYDHNGEELLRKQTENKRIYSTETANIMSDMLSSVVSDGTAKEITLKRSINTAGKTGTSGDDFDRLFVGYTPYYTAGIWCGHQQTPQPIGKQKISHLQLWDEVMLRIHEKYMNEPTRSFSKKGLIRLPYCQDSGCRETEICSLDLRGTRTAYGYFTPDNMPSGQCKTHIPVLYDRLTSAVATECCPEEEVTLVSLIRLPSERHFFEQVYVTDAQYAFYETKKEDPLGDSYDIPYFIYVIPEGDFVGITRGKKQLNSSCYLHRD